MPVRTPECEAFNSPTSRFISQFTLAGVGAPAISGAYTARIAFQSTPFIRGSWKLSLSHVHAWSNAVILSCAKSMSTSAFNAIDFALPPSSSGTANNLPSSR